MTLAEASLVVAAHLQALGLASAGLDAQGRASALVEGEQVVFEYDAQDGQLTTSALIYRWREWAVAGLLEALRQEAEPGRSDTGGGELLYVPSRKTLCLAKHYAAVPAPATFAREQARLREACALWRGEIFPRVAERVRHPGA